MHKLFMLNPKEFFRLLKAGLYNRLTRQCMNAAAWSSKKALRLLGGNEPEVVSPAETLRDNETWVIVVVWKGSVDLHGIAGHEQDVENYLSRFPGAFYIAQRIDEIKQKIIGITIARTLRAGPEPKWKM